MTEWILAFQSSSYASALQRWQQTKSLPWLVAAIASPVMNAAPHESSGKVSPIAVPLGHERRLKSVIFTGGRIRARPSVAQERR